MLVGIVVGIFPDRRWDAGDPRPKMIGHLPPDLEGLQMRRQ